MVHLQCLEGSYPDRVEVEVHQCPVLKITTTVVGSLSSCRSHSYWPHLSRPGNSPRPEPSQCVRLPRSGMPNSRTASTSNQLRRRMNQWRSRPPPNHRIPRI